MATSSQKSIASQWSHMDQLQDAFLPRVYEREMPNSFRTHQPPTVFDDELDDGDFEYEATLMNAFYEQEKEEEQGDKTVARLRQILDHLKPLYNTSLATTLKGQ